MLPLWIIDLTQDTGRRKTFTDLLGQVKGVLTDDYSVCSEREKTPADAMREFSDLYENKENARDCIWYYSHIKNPFKNKEVLNAPYRPSEQDKADINAYFKALLELEAESNDKLKDIQDREGNYRKELFDIFNRDFQEVAVKEGQSFMDLLVKTMADAKAKALEKKNSDFEQEVVDALCLDFEQKLEAEGESFKGLLDKAMAEAESKASMNAKTIADAKAKVLEEFQLKSHRVKFETLYNNFEKKVKAETQEFKAKMLTIKQDAKLTAESVEKNNEKEIIQKDIFEQLYQEFQKHIVEEGREFMDLLVESMNDSETKIMQEAKQKMLLDKEVAYHTDIARTLYKDFQEKVVEQGQKFIDLLRRTSGHAYSVINICVIGDSTEKFSRLVFPSVAVMLQKEKGRILPHHVHQGVSILGAFYIPSNVNARDVNERDEIRKTLEEIDVQHNISTVRGYDRMLYYQNVQNRAENVYPLLNREAEAQYLLQCLEHLYYACSEVHPLMSGVSDDCFYFSMGATSVYFDSLLQNERDKHRVAKDLFEEFLKDGDLEKPDTGAPWFNGQVYLVALNATTSEGAADKEAKQVGYLADLDLRDTLKPENIIDVFREVSIPIDDVQEPTIRLDPIVEFRNKDLKRIYFLQDLKYYPAEMHYLINEYVDGASKEKFEASSKARKTITDDFSMKLSVGVKTLLKTCNVHTGGLKRVETNVDDLKTNIGKIRERVDALLETELWQNEIIGKDKNVPKKLRDFFIDYHQAYCGDLKAKSVKERCLCKSKKDIALKLLRRNLESETPLLSRLAKNFLQSLVTTIAMVPLLKMLSPDVFDLGDVYSHAALWATGIFMIPVLIQIITLLCYYWNRRNIKNRLKAMYLHDAYARFVNRAYTEIQKYYDDCTELCDKYLKRCELIRKEVRIPDWKQDDLELPETRFNQPLAGGNFGGNLIMGEDEVEPAVIRLPMKFKCKVPDLNRSDYFSLINGYNDGINILMRGIRLTEEQTHHYDDEKQQEVFESKDYQAKREKQEWEDSKKEFLDRLFASIENDLLPRNFPTVGDKVLGYSEKYANDSKKQSTKVLVPFTEYAATNGEFTTSADNEFVDFKTNDRRVEDLLKSSLNVIPNVLEDKDRELYQRFMFLTRWRVFDYVRLNRVLPLEDFDEESRKELVCDIAANKQKRKQEACYPSSLLLLALSRVGVSRDTNWLRLFPDRLPSGTVKADMDAYLNVLNVND